MQAITIEKHRIAACRLCGLRSTGPLCGGCAERLELDLQMDRGRACSTCGRHLELCHLMPCDKQLSQSHTTSTRNSSSSSSSSSNGTTSTYTGTGTGTGTSASASSASGTQKSNLVWLPVDRIDEPPAAQNSRHVYTDKAIRELADSLRQDGLLQPICVRPKGSRFEVVFGVRRLRAAKQAGIHDIPCSVRVADDHRAFLLNVLENLHREQLSNTERVRTIERLAATGLGVREISRRTGFNPSTISRWLRINSRVELKQALEDGRIDIARAVALVEAPTPALPELLELAPNVSVADLRARVASIKSQAHGRGRPETPSRRHLRDVLRSLRGIKFCAERDLLDSIRQEVDRLSAAAV